MKSHPHFFMWFLIGAVLSCLISSADAQEAEKKDDGAESVENVLPGHSSHGEAFNEGPRQKAYLMGGVGNVHLKITTKDPMVQKFFDQGLGQLHGFWYLEAERSFRQAASMDPDCGMLYWGMAMANFSNDKRGKEFSQKAAERRESASPRERLWINGLAS
ncbi:MAG: alkyl hydroperoxide reductase, partial [Planctomycetales bacterium]